MVETETEGREEHPAGLSCGIPHVPLFPRVSRISDLQHGRDRLTFAGEAREDLTVVKEHHPSVHVFIHISVFPPCLHLSHARVRALLVLDQPSRLLSPFGITPLPLKLDLYSSRAG